MLNWKASWFQNSGKGSPKMEEDMGVVIANQDESTSDHQVDLSKASDEVLYERDKLVAEKIIKDTEDRLNQIEESPDASDPMDSETIKFIRQEIKNQAEQLAEGNQRMRQRVRQIKVDSLKRFIPKEEDIEKINPRLFRPKMFE